MKQTYKLPDAWAIPYKVGTVTKSCYMCGLYSVCETKYEGETLRGCIDLTRRGCCNFVLDVDFKDSLEK